MRFLIIALPILALVFGPGLWVQRVLAKYSQPDDRYSGSGSDLARKLLDINGLQNVKVEVTESGDHYDPNDKAVRLTSEKFDGRSLTAITVAAHEVGHAVQDKEAYKPMRVRGLLVRGVQKVEKVGAGILILAPFMGILTRAPGLGIIMFVGGLLTLASSTLVHMVTLPTEFDASFGRALPMLQEHRILIDNDMPHARKILKAAAFTYVSASLMSLLNIARWFAILRR
jgi:Zn-dependent membrane protease YugP